MSLVCNLDHKHRLFWLSDPLIVALEKVISHSYDFSLMLELHSDWIHIENDISDKVGSLVTPVSDDTFFTEFKLDHLFPSVLVALNVISNLKDSL